MKCPICKGTGIVEEGSGRVYISGGEPVDDYREVECVCRAEPEWPPEEYDEHA